MVIEYVTTADEASERPLNEIAKLSSESKGRDGCAETNVSGVPGRGTTSAETPSWAPPWCPLGPDHRPCSGKV